ncbi:hypothetical protein HD806DRAFT_518681 [Xylariaceae sp. AK1471]|nr:hypothetical protein HD806DRAFT_518681 [Xylariaceae sp. AK1471]
MTERRSEKVKLEGPPHRYDEQAEALCRVFDIFPIVTGSAKIPANPTNNHGNTSFAAGNDIETGYIVALTGGLDITSGDLKEGYETAAKGHVTVVELLVSNERVDKNLQEHAGLTPL